MVDRINLNHLIDRFSYKESKEGYSVLRPIRIEVYDPIFDHIREIRCDGKFVNIVCVEINDRFDEDEKFK